MFMKSVGLKVLKNRLSEYVRLAAKGEVILVTDRDEVVAELSPPRSDRSLSAADALLADAVRNGWVRPPLLPNEGIPPRHPMAKFKKLMRDLNRDRSDR
jgi:antitoxin (DNA-binding transcriptional repressor) of toxin-antitoxin stability system